MAHLKTVLHDKAEQYARTCHSQRKEAYRAKLRADWADGGRQLYTCIREKRLRHAQAIRASDDALLTQPQSMVDEIAQQWQRMCTKPSLCDPRALLREIGPDLPTAPCDLPDITGQELLDQFKQMNSQRMPTTDAWRTRKLADLPLSCTNWMAQQLMGCEEGVPWPSQLTTGLTSCIPNPGTTDDPYKVETGDLMAQAEDSTSH